MELGLFVILFGLMVAGWLLTDVTNNFWHRRCPRCGAAPKGKHADGCEYKDRL